MRHSPTASPPEPYITPSPTLPACSDPRDVPRALRKIADDFNAAASELSSAWQSPGAGAVWADFARYLSTTADRCDAALTRHRLS